MWILFRIRKKKAECKPFLCWVGMPAYSITSAKTYSYRALIAYQDSVTSNLQVGAEYLRGWRTDFNDATRHANRMNLLVQYSF